MVRQKHKVSILIPHLHLEKLTTINLQKAEAYKYADQQTFILI